MNAETLKKAEQAINAFGHMIEAIEKLALAQIDLEREDMGILAGLAISKAKKLAEAADGLDLPGAAKLRQLAGDITEASYKGESSSAVFQAAHKAAGEMDYARDALENARARSRGVAA